MWLLRTLLIAGIALIISAFVTFDIHSTRIDERLTAKFSEGPTTFTFTAKEKFLTGGDRWVNYLTEDNETKAALVSKQQFTNTEVNDVVTIQVDYIGGAFVYSGDIDYISLLPNELRTFYNIPKLPIFLIFFGVLMLRIAKAQYNAGFMLRPRVVME